MIKKILSACSKGIVAVILAMLIMTVTYGFSWIVTCGFIKLITLCFGWTFDWSLATGVWLIMCLATRVFSKTVTVK